MIKIGTIQIKRCVKQQMDFAILHGDFIDGKERGTFSISNRILINYGTKDDEFIQYEVNLKPVFDQVGKFHKELKKGKWNKEKC
jgi:hypothetical protein